METMNMYLHIRIASLLKSEYFFEFMYKICTKYEERHIRPNYTINIINISVRPICKVGLDPWYYNGDCSPGQCMETRIFTAT